MQVTFYELIASSLEKALPRILEKIYESGLKAVVRIENMERLKSIDNAIWTYTTMGFIPHGTMMDPPEFIPHQPVWLTTQDDNPIGASVLVITTKSYVINIAYDRLLDIYDGNNPQNVQNAMERMEKYRQNGHEVIWWKQNLKGSWEKGI